MPRHQAHGAQDVLLDVQKHAANRIAESSTFLCTVDWSRKRLVMGIVVLLGAKT
jgi:hypothetical protein